MAPPTNRTRERPPDLLVFVPSKEWTCAECGAEHGHGDMLTLGDAGTVCLDCSDLGHLWFLPAGDTAVTRRSKAASTLSAVVLKWSRARRRYERQGLLVEGAAIEQAEASCLADDEVRQRRRERDAERRRQEDVTLVAELCAAIVQQFPGCPPERAAAIARHTARRNSGRVGRSSAGRALDPHAVRLAVVASVRHEDTGYDTLLSVGVPREEARAQVGPHVDRVLSRWSRAQPRAEATSTASRAERHTSS